jgi:copper resistance protein D
MAGYQIVVLLHLFSAVVWIGGTIFLAAVLIPVTRKHIEPPSEGARVLGIVARRFRVVSYAAVGLLIATGLWLAIDHWGISPGEFFTADATWFLEALRVKVSLVVAILALSLLHDMYLGPKLAASQEGRRDGPPSAETVRARRNLIWMARVNVLLVVALLAVTVSMTRGNPF